MPAKKPGAKTPQSQVPRYLPPPPTTRVRCLGPFGGEHTFPSPDPKRVRVCERCRDRLRGQQLGRRAEMPYTVVIE